MKRFIIVLLLMALLIGALGGCGGTSALTGYHTLLEEMRELREYSFQGTVTIFLAPELLGEVAFLFEAFLPLNLSVEGAVSYANREMWALYRYRQMDGTPLFEMEMVLAGGRMYMGLSSMLEHMLRPVFAELGVGFSEVSMEDILGDYEYLAIPYDGALTELMFGPMETVAGLDVEPFLARQGEAYVVTVLDEDVRALTDEIGEMLGQFLPDDSFGGAFAIGDVLGDVGRQLAEANLYGARVVESTYREGERFHQTVEMEVPGLLDMRASFSFTAETGIRVPTPTEALTEGEFEALLRNIDFGALVGGPGPGTAQHLPDYITLLYDLVGMNLVGHVLDEDSHLETMALGNGHGGEHIVTVIARGATAAGEYHIVCDADAIVMYYISLDNLDAVEAVLLAVNADRAGYFLPDSSLTFSVLRTNNDRSLAAMAIAEQTAAGMTRVCIYLGQVVAATGDVIRLEMVFYLDLFTPEDYETLAELSSHIRVDLLAYITALLSAA